MNRPKRAGTAWETAVVTYLQAHGFPHAERRALRGTRDTGDVAGLPGWVVECKNEKAIDLAGYMDEVAAELANIPHTGMGYGVAVVKRRGYATGRAYVIMELQQFTDILKEL